MQSEPLIVWSDPVKELIGFLALFLAAGGIGFRFFALRGRRIESDRPFYDDAAHRAALLGLAGVVVMGINAFLALALIGYGLASARTWAGWPVAAVGVVAGALRNAFLGQWSRLVNPIHSLAAGMWIGTLFVLVVAGLSALMRHEPTRERRGAIAADMVNGFSPLALTMGGVVVVFGVITAWRHLHVLSNLWSTPYGYALIAKLVFVGLVFALGAWNWRRQRPTLGGESAAASIRRSSTAELSIALVVLVITAIVVSLPSPKG